MGLDTSLTTKLDKLPPEQRKRFEALVESHGADWVGKNWDRLKDEGEWLGYSDRKR